jgi:hypothetical protein
VAGLFHVCHIRTLGWLPVKRQELVGMLSLLLTALIWGFAFVAQVQGMDSMSPMFFNATRFTLGALVFGADSAVAAWPGERG